MVTPKGKEGHKDMLNPLEGLQHLNHSRDSGTFLGRERSQGKTHLQSAMEKEKSTADIVQSLWWGEGTCPLGGCQQLRARRRRKWFSGHCSSETADGGEEQEWELEWSADS